MNRDKLQLDAWLTELGQARAEGLFEPVRNAQMMPWKAVSQKAAEPVARRNIGGRSLMRIAAAACVGLVLIGIWRIESNWTAPQPAAPAPTLALASRDAGDVQTDSTSMAAARVEALPGDFNGDGRVDGEDIQFYLNQQAQKPKSEVSKDASDFARKLLGS